MSNINTMGLTYYYNPSSYKYSFSKKDGFLVVDVVCPIGLWR